MKTYLFTWKDIDMGTKATMRLNEKQTELINYLYEELAFGDVLEMANVDAELIDETENSIVDLT